MFPCFDGVFCCDGKKGVFGYVNSQAFHFQKSIEFKHKAILHNVIFLRGIEFLIYFFEGAFAFKQHGKWWVQSIKLSCTQNKNFV